MELGTFIGSWENEAGNRLVIERKDNNSLAVSFYKRGNIPVQT